MSFLDTSNLTYLWSKIKAKFVPLDEDSEIDGTLGVDTLQANEVDSGHFYCSGTDSTSINTAGGIKATGNITAANLTASHTGDYTGSYTLGNCTILTGYKTLNVSASNTNTDSAVTFGVTFKHNPNIQLTMLNIGSSYYQKISAAGPSTTGFTIRVRAGNAVGTVNVVWMAIGELA